MSMKIKREEIWWVLLQKMPCETGRCKERTDDTEFIFCMMEIQTLWLLSSFQEPDCYQLVPLSNISSQAISNELLPVSQK